MLGHLIRKEILDQILSLRFLVLAAVGGVAIWMSLYDGYAYYHARLVDYRLAQAAAVDRTRQIMGGDWVEPGEIGHQVHKSPTPMSIFVRGLEPVLGRSGSVSFRDVAVVKQSPATEEPLLGLFPPLDLGLMVQVVLSLFVLLFTYDTVCGEKEAGTLRLIASFSLPRHVLLIGKLLGTLIPTLTAFGLPLLLGIVVILSLPDVQLNATEWTRLGFILAAFGFYLTAFGCAGLLASSLTHRAATSFVLLLTFWVITVAIVPRLGLIAADAVRTAPSFHKYQADRAAIFHAAYQERLALQIKWSQEHSQPGQEWYKTPEVREAYFLYRRKIFREYDGRRFEQQEKLQEAFQNRYQARLDLAVVFSRLSPAFTLNHACVRLAGTGVERHRRFQKAYQTHIDRHQDWYRETRTRDQLRQANPEKYGEYRYDVADYPSFTYRETWPDRDIQTGLIDVGMLVLWGAVFFAGAYAALLRYDLR